MNRALVLLIVIFIAFFLLLYLGCKKEEVEPTPPTAGEVQAKIEKIEASSVLMEHPQEPDRFVPEKVNDGLASTCWAEGAKGWGQGEWVKFTFNVPVDITGVDIINGFAIDEERYYDNAAVKMLAVEFSNGGKANLELNDQETTQFHPLDGEGVSWVKFTIDQVFRGEKWEDTCISEIRPDFSASAQ